MGVSQLKRISRAIIPQPDEAFFIAHDAFLLVLHGGEPQFDELMDKRDCIVFIPAAISGSPVVVITDPGQGIRRTTTITFEVNFVYLIAARCLISIPDETELVCVMLCIWRGST